MKFSIGTRVRVGVVDIEGWQGRRLHPLSDQNGKTGTVRGYGAEEDGTQLYYVLMDEPCEMYEFVEYELTSTWAIQMHEEGLCGDLHAIEKETRARGAEDLADAVRDVRQMIEGGAVQILIGPLPRRS